MKRFGISAWVSAVVVSLAMAACGSSDPKTPAASTSAFVQEVCACKDLACATAVIPKGEVSAAESDAAMACIKKHQ